MGIAAARAVFPLDTEGVESLMVRLGQIEALIGRMQAVIDGDALSRHSRAGHTLQTVVGEFTNPHGTRHPAAVANEWGSHNPQELA